MDGKDIVFEEPRVPNRYAKEDAEDKTQPRGYWTVSEIEGVMWRIRASGGTDSTPVKFGRGRRLGGTAIRAENIEAFEFEVPRRESPSVEPPAPREPLPLPVRRAAQVAGALLALPLLLAALVVAWRLFWGVAF